jgi:hypothetical protein
MSFKGINFLAKIFYILYGITESTLNLTRNTEIGFLITSHKYSVSYGSNQKPGVLERSCFSNVMVDVLCYCFLFSENGYLAAISFLEYSATPP